MKKLLAIAAVVFATNANAGALSMAEGVDKPVEVIFEVSNVQKDDLFIRSKTWVSETFVSGKSVIDSAEKETGTIIAKGYIDRACEGMFDCLANGGNKVGFKLRIDTKDGKVRTTYTNFTILRPAESGRMVGNVYVSGSGEEERPVVIQGDLDAAVKGAMQLSDSLKAYLSKETEKSNW
ncbi:MAG: hypothetical protein C0406_04540 [Sideroxydans sp.]|nr:hypothetical protein [Sideroxydans sp.]